MPLRRLVVSVLALVAALAAAGPGVGAEATTFTDGIPAGMAPADIEAGAGGNLWFTGDGAIGRITPAGAVTIFTEGLGAGAAPDGITRGPDGNVWFADPAGDQIGTIAPQGTITTFPTDLGLGTGPLDIASGSDGRLYFTAPDAGAIGRMSASGGAVEWIDGLPEDAAPVRIVAGINGTMWFTDYAGDRIGRIDREGGVTQFPVAGAGPAGLVLGPDLNLWFAAYDAGAIGRITPAGAVSLFAVPDGPGPVEISTGPDGALWFLREASVTPERVATAGDLLPPLSFSGAAPSEPLAAITLGFDGRIWATSPGRNRIVRFALEERPPTVTPPVAAPPARTAPRQPPPTTFFPRPAPRTPLTFAKPVPPPPGLRIVAVTDMRTSRVTLHTDVETHGALTEVDIRLGTSPGQGTRLRFDQAHGASSAVRVRRVVGRLTPGTTYYYRLTARSRGGSAYADGAFRTAPAPALSRVRATATGISVHAGAAGLLRVAVLRSGSARPVVTMSRRVLASGPVTLRLDRGRLGHALRPGRYRVRATLVGAQGGRVEITTDVRIR